MRDSKLGEYIKETGDGIKSVGGIMAAASLVGGFISEEFSTIASVSGVIVGLGIQQVGIMIKTMLDLSKDRQGGRNEK